MPTPDRIAALTAQAILAAVRDYARTGNVARWERAMRDAIAHGHTAASIAGTAERLGVREGSALLNSRNLSREERRAIQGRVAGQLPYLRAFADEVRRGDKSDAQVAAQSALYAGATRATWSEARWFGANLPAHPTEGSECMSNCKCSWVLRDDGFYWEQGVAEHCPTCNTRASDWRPWRGR